MAKKRKRRKKAAKTYIKLDPKAKKKFAKYHWVFKALLALLVLYVAYLNFPRFWHADPKEEVTPKTKTETLRPTPSVERKTPTPKPIPAPAAVPAPKPVVKERHAPPKKVHPPAKTLSATKPKVVFVIDDMGNTNDHVDLLRELGSNVTYAILPLVQYSTFFSRLSLQTGAEVILHQPLEAIGGTIPGPGLVTSRMSRAHIYEMLDRNLNSVPQHSGMNNHMGSYGTSSERVMTILMDYLREQNLFFLDSFTTSKSQALSLANKKGVPVIRRDVFLDNTDLPEAIISQVEDLATVAKKKGYAIGIGHYRKNTLEVLAEEIPRLKRSGYEIVSLHDLMQHLERNS